MTDLAAKLKELARKNQLDPLGVVPTYRDGCEETEGNIDGWMVCELLRDFKGEPDVEDPFAVGLSRNAADLIAETLNALPQIIAALEARPSPAPDEVERVALQILLAREGLDCDLAMVSDYERHLARAAIAALRPAMPEVPRFFIEHGQIHDRHTGKHVTTDEDSVFCDGINSALALLNRLDADARAAPAPATEGEVEAVARAIYEAAPPLRNMSNLSYGSRPITDTVNASPTWGAVRADAASGSNLCLETVEATFKRARAALSAARPSREGELERLREERRDLAMSLGLPGDEEHSFEELANSAEQLARIAGKAAVRASREGEMRAALEPFALSGERDWDDDAPDATELWCCQGPGYYPNRSVLTVGDLRRARAALQPQQPGSSDA